MNRTRWMFIVGLIVLLTSAAWALDLNESFEETLFPPPAWQSLETGDGANLWIRMQNSSWSHTGLALAQSTEDTLAGGLVAQRWLITPKLSVGSTTDSVAFWVRTMYSFISDNDSLYVLLSTTDSLPASFTVQLAGYKCGSLGDFLDVYTRFASSLGTYNGLDVFVAFLHRDEGSAGNRLYFDDVTGPEAIAPPYQAKTPNPANHAVGVAANTNLTWVNGTGTSTIDLYFAQTFDSVNTSVAAAKKIDNVLATSYDPPWDLLANQQYFWKVVTRNAYGVTVSPVWDFTVTGAPLAGSYDIGGGNNNYPNFTTAVAALYGNGISDAVTFNVYGGDYNEQVKLRGAIPGASATDTIKFLDASGTARLRVTSLLPYDQGAIHDSAVSYVIFDGIDIMLDQVHDSTYHCLVLKAGASNNIFRNATWRGAGSAITGIRYGIQMGGTACNNNLFDNLHLKRNNIALYLYGSAANRHTGNVIQNCTIDSVCTAFYLYYTRNTQIRDNDLQFNGGGSGVYGVDFNTHLSGDADYIYRNKFHNLVSSGSPSFIYARGGAGTILNVYNNFFYDVQVPSAATPYVALYTSSGTTNFDFNSIRINDVASTGTVNAIYNASSSAVLNIRNNIFYSAEATTQTNIYCSLSGYVPAILDYNAYYNAGANALFSVYRVGTAYATVAALRAATVYEDWGVEGNPGFMSATNLHIDPDSGLCHLNGVAIAGISDDIDKETRLSTPDIGADEYVYNAPANDYAVRELYGLELLNGQIAIRPELTPITTDAWVQNRGSANQTNVRVTLFYDGLPQDTQYVSLNAYASDTVTFDWTTPAAPDTITVEVQSFLTSDAVLANDSATASARILGLPMHGTYDIGGGAAHYANFSSAVADLTLRTMDGAVIFDVYGTTYTDSLVMGPITGATATYTITFQEHVTALDEPVVLTWASGSGVVRLNGADYVTIDGIDITATGTCSRGVQMYNGADHNTVKNCTITGPSVSLTTTYGVHVQSGGNDYNTFDHLTVSGSYYGIDLYAASGTVDIGNEVKNCSVLEGAFGVRTYYQRGCRVHDCDIQPGWTTPNVNVFGLYASSQTAGDTVFYYNNRIHNIRSAGSFAGNGIYTVATPARFYNNFIWDFQATGTGAVYGIQVFGGSPEFYFNSVHIGDVATTGGTGALSGINGFFEQTLTSSAILKNNIFQIEEPTVACYAINRYQGTLVSDYNCVYRSVPGGLYNMGRDASTNYATLAAWRLGTVYDDSSIAGNPGFFSPADLHIAATYDLVDSEGVAIAGIGTDIDGDARAGVPDIGADEYTYSTFAHDYGVIRFIGLLPTYTGTTPYVIQAEVKNWGTNDEIDVPVRLYYNNVQQDVALVSLLAGQLGTVNLDWTPPNVGYEIGELKAKAFCPSDGYAANDSMTAEVNVIGGPMSGTYDLGGGSMDFATFADALQCLYLRGIDGETIIDVYGGTYNENVILVNTITGASFTDRVIFRAHQSPLNDIVTLTSNINTPCARFDGVDYVTFDGMDMVGTVACDTVVSIINDADYVTLKNLRVTGRDSTLVSVKGIRVAFNGNDDCLIDNVTITGVYYGIRGEGGTGQSDRLEVKNCHISGAPYCVYLDDMHNARVHDNDLQPKGYASASAYGVYVAALTSGDTAYVYNNRIHNLRHTATTGFATVAGIYTTSGAMVYLFNNFIWDWQTAGPIMAGIYLSTGTNYCGFNTIRMNDTENLVAQKSGIYIAAGTAVVGNNIIVIEETADTCYGIWRAGGTLTASDYHCFRGVSPWYYVGRDGTTLYATLANWQVLGRDLNSLTGDPGFISASDLHIDSTYLLVNDVGFYVAEVQTDIDGDVRNNPPDIGADEYGRRDYRVIGFVGLLAEYLSQTPYTIQADVQNNGNIYETNIPVRLYYDDVLQSTVLVTLAAGIRDTIDFAWTTPDTSYQVDTLEAQAFCPNDGIPTNDSALANVTVIRPPAAVDSLTIFPDVATGNVLLRWTPSAEANSYKIYRGTTVGFVIDGSTYVNQTAATTYTNVGALSLGVKIFYVVIASTDPIAR